MPGLILIDFQVGFDAPFWGACSSDAAEARAGVLLAHWRAARGSVMHVRHLSLEEGSPLSGAGAAFKPALAPIEGEAVFEKHVNSGFIGTGLEAHLRAAGLDSLVICGLTTPHCVSTTCRMAANLGFDVTLAHDACAAYEVNANPAWGGPKMSAQDIHASAVSHLHGEFAQAKAVDHILKGPV